LRSIDWKVTYHGDSRRLNDAFIPSLIAASKDTLTTLSIPAGQISKHFVATLLAALPPNLKSLKLNGDRHYGDDRGSVENLLTQLVTLESLELPGLLVAKFACLIPLSKLRHLIFADDGGERGLVDIIDLAQVIPHLHLATITMDAKPNDHSNASGRNLIRSAQGANVELIYRYMDTGLDDDQIESEWMQALTQKFAGTNVNFFF
jgi:hypothetical protein